LERKWWPWHGHIRISADNGIFGALAGGAGGFIILRRRHAARLQLAGTVERLLFFARGRLRILDAGLCRQERSLSAFDLCGERRRVEFGEHIAFLDALVLLELDRAHHAGLFAGDIDLGDGLQSARG
jgi:hypothetical protein